ncbi:YhbY family RNA-binding protein [Marinicella litoralis]|uniref:RNA-binding protein n=1 Tax=Marinicella litoralis TaxID=644220 RepID=A0A4R6XY53_9GAMM|nr:YhbY family RNA-binding protein [Marinicella litoralis]TDR22653.1 RNA-binding protein [Marinicella litoralis]
MSNKAVNKSSNKPLSKNALKFLRGIAHDTKPVVTIADKGITENILIELDICLNQHELVKIKIRADREAREQFTSQILKESGAQMVQSIGQTLTIYRANPKKPVFELPR